MPGAGASLKEITLIYKPASTSRANTAVLADDPHLLFPIAANERILLRLWSLYIAGAGGIQFTVNGPGGFIALSYTNTIVPHNVAPRIASSSAAWLATVALAGATNGFLLMDLGLLNGANPGNLVLQWAQQAANPANTTLYHNSSIIVHRLI